MAKSKHAKSVSVLVVGNSFTQRNNMPGLIGTMAKQHGIKFTHPSISAGGASLKRHWNAGNAVSAIERGGHDYVVLQEQSNLPVKTLPKWPKAFACLTQSLSGPARKLCCT
jgi:hypothetical protein